MVVFRFRDISLKSKMILMIIVISCTVLLLTCIMFLINEMLTYRYNVNHELSVLANVVGKNTASALTHHNTVAAQENIDALRADPRIISAAILDIEGNVVASYSQAPNDSEISEFLSYLSDPEVEQNNLIVEQPIVLDSEVVGTIYIQASPNALYLTLKRQLQISGLILLFSSCLTYLLAARLQRHVSDPLVDLSRVVTNISAQGDYSIRVKHESKDEVGELYDGFNIMLAHIQEQENERDEALAILEATNETLRRSEAQLQAILDNTTSIIYLKDPQGRYVMVNQRYEELFDVEREWVRGKTDFDIFPEEIANAIQANDRRAMIVGVPLELEELAPQKDRLRTYLTVKFPLFNNRGVPYAVCGIGTDITDRKRVEEAIRENEAKMRAIVATACRWNCHC